MKGTIKLIKNAAANNVNHLVDKDLNVVRKRSIKPFLFLLLVLALYILFLKDRNEAL